MSDPSAGIDPPVLPDERDRALAAAQAILDQGGWCMLEACVDVADQVWEPRVLIFDLVAEQVADAVEEEIACEPEHDARLTACNRRTLQPDPELGEYLFYLADGAFSRSLAAPPPPERTP